MHQEGAVGLEHQEAYCFGEPRGQPARIENFAAGNDETHGRRTVLSVSDDG